MHHIGIDVVIDMHRCIRAKHWTRWANYSFGWQRCSTAKKRIPDERKWFTEGICYWQRQEFQIIEDLRSKYPVRPLEIVVSDMTCIRCNGRIYEWVLFIDTFNNEILHILFLHIEEILKPTITVWINYANA